MEIANQYITRQSTLSISGFDRGTDATISLLSHHDLTIGSYTRQFDPLTPDGLDE